MNKTSYIIIILALILSVGIIFLSGAKNNTETSGSTQNVEVKDGIQYIMVNARGGYSPRVSNAKANIPTKLLVRTNGTYDCSASLMIRSVGFQKILAQTGEEIIDLGVPQAGQSIQGVCSMGMYYFKLNFN